MKTTDLLLLGGVAVGGYFLLKSSPVQSQPAPSPAPQPWPMPMPSPLPSPSPAPQPAPTPVSGFNLSGFLSQITEIALGLLPQGPPSISIGPTAPGDGVSTLPNSSSWFSDYNFGPGWDIFKPGEVHFGV